MLWIRKLNLLYLLHSWNSWYGALLIENLLADLSFLVCSLKWLLSIYVGIGIFQPWVLLTRMIEYFLLLRIFFYILKHLFICLESQNYRKRESEKWKEISSICWLYLPRWPQWPGLGFSQSQELHPGLLRDDQTLHPSFCCSSRTVSRGLHRK